MADNEKLKKSYLPRRNPQQNRPPPGVQKAMQTFGVRDLREILDKKRQEQGESQGEKRPDSKLVKLPPPDPTYNYLKDPTRDKPKEKKVDRERQLERPTPKDREIYSAQQRHKSGNYSNRENVQNPKDTRQQQEKENNSTVQEKGVLKKNQNSSYSEGTPKKELRFSDTPSFEGQLQFSRNERHSFRGRNAKRGGGVPRENKQEKIENPVNIKIELSTETGQRNCILDENTKIADIKHVPDKIPYQRSPRGGFRGGRGNFRSRGRGRGSFHGRGGYSYKEKIESTNYNDTFNMEDLQKNLPDGSNKKNQQSAENGNIPSKNTIEQDIQDSNIQNLDTQVNSEENLQPYDDYDQENEEYNDANENYDEYYSEYRNNSSEYAQNFDETQKSESSAESDRYNHAPVDIVDPNLNTTITITSSVMQDREVKRSVEVKPLNSMTENEGNTQRGTNTGREM